MFINQGIHIPFAVETRIKNCSTERICTSVRAFIFYSFASCLSSHFCFSFTLRTFVYLSLYCFRYAITKAFCVAFLMTFFSVFDVPVFWPILFFYWVFLFILTMKRQITHMIKYRYVPFNIGKQSYAGKKSAEGAKVHRID
ncbi:protein RER1B-like [Olea europaea var. sylvestris]|uniref:protein RER1B-like n=1 Tax=Olea europaea var. sylvestris TaxID=158386 RepID=UPI000C1D81EE|nr:protein RER1B-like [Olea europaea var. sylvestris]